MRHLLVLAVLLTSLLLGDARPGWCPFSEPSPGAGIRLPEVVSPPLSTPQSPQPAVYPVFDRPREVDDRPHQGGQNGGPSMISPSGAPNAWGQPAPPPEPSAHWTGNPMWIASACLLVLLLGLMPLLWMRRASAEQSLPEELGPRKWRGWTQRPGRSS